MKDFGIIEMQQIQQCLLKNYQDKWQPICAESGQSKLLWMIGEIGEVIDIIKKHGGTAATEDIVFRKKLVEELADVLMCYNEVLMCYGIAADELERAYREKFTRNMERW